MTQKEYNSRKTTVAGSFKGKNLAGKLPLMMLLRRQDDAASTDAGWVGGEVQRTRTGSEVLRPCADALQPHVDVGRARGDRGDD